MAHTQFASLGKHMAGAAEQDQMLRSVLREARRAAHAQAGSLYLLEGGKLRFVEAQNDVVAPGRLESVLSGRVGDVSDAWVAGHVARTGSVINVPDVHNPPADLPCAINTEADRLTGFRTRTLLALPLECSPGERVGVLQLLNRAGEGGRVEAFREADEAAVRSLAAVAALGLHNMLLQNRLQQAHVETIIRLSVAAEFRDNATAEHIARVSHTSAVLAEGFGMPPDYVELLRCASPMHDIGKIGIPDSILLKPGRLTPEERQIMERHTTIGADILGQSASDLMSLARKVALTHHERWDGTGYPNRLAEREIPLCGRIVGLADVFDALISKRCYKDAFEADMSLDIIRRDQGKHFDPCLTEVFFENLSSIMNRYDSGGEAGDASLRATA